MIKKIVTREECSKLGGTFNERVLSEKKGLYSSVCKISIPTRKEDKISEIISKITIGKGKFFQYHDGTNVDITNSFKDMLSLSSKIPTTLSITEEKDIFTLKFKDSIIQISRVHPEASLYDEDAEGFIYLK